MARAAEAAPPTAAAPATTATPPPPPPPPPLPPPPLSPSAHPPPLTPSSAGGSSSPPSKRPLSGAARAWRTARGAAKYLGDVDEAEKQRRSRRRRRRVDDGNDDDDAAGGGASVARKTARALAVFLVGDLRSEEHVELAQQVALAALAPGTADARLTAALALRTRPVVPLPHPLPACGDAVSLDARAPWRFCPLLARAAGKLAVRERFERTRLVAAEETGAWAQLRAATSAAVAALGAAAKAAAQPPPPPPPLPPPEEGDGDIGEVASPPAGAAAPAAPVYRSRFDDRNLAFFAAQGEQRRVAAAVRDGEAADAVRVLRMARRHDRRAAAAARAREASAARARRRAERGLARERAADAARAARAAAAAEGARAAARGRLGKADEAHAAATGLHRLFRVVLGGDLAELGRYARVAGPGGVGEVLCAATDARGRTPLHFAAHRNDAAVVGTLLGGMAKGCPRCEVADVPATRGGYTVLHYAALGGALDAAELLVAAAERSMSLRRCGDYLRTLSRDGLSARDVAEASGYAAVAHFLARAEVRLPFVPDEVAATRQRADVSAAVECEMQTLTDNVESAADRELRVARARNMLRKEADDLKEAKACLVRRAEEWHGAELAAAAAASAGKPPPRPPPPSGRYNRNAVLQAAGEAAERALMEEEDRRSDACRLYAQVRAGAGRREAERRAAERARRRARARDDPGFVRAAELCLRKFGLVVADDPEGGATDADGGDRPQVCVARTTESAAAAGVRGGDGVFAVGGVVVADAAAFYAEALRAAAGELLELELRRGGGCVRLAVPADGARLRRHYGLCVTDGQRVGSRGEGGVVGYGGVLVLRLSGPAEGCGLRAGDTVCGVNGDAVRTCAELHAALEAAGGRLADVAYTRGGERLRRTARVAPREVYEAEENESLRALERALVMLDDDDDGGSEADNDDDGGEAPDECSSRLLAHPPPPQPSPAPPPVPKRHCVRTTVPAGDEAAAGVSSWACVGVSGACSGLRVAVVDTLGGGAHARLSGLRVLGLGGREVRGCRVLPGRAAALFAQGRDVSAAVLPFTLTILFPQPLVPTGLALRSHAGDADHDPALLHVSALAFPPAAAVVAAAGKGRGGGGRGGEVAGEAVVVPIRMEPARRAWSAPAAVPLLPMPAVAAAEAAVAAAARSGGGGSGHGAGLQGRRSTAWEGEFSPAPPPAAAAAAAAGRGRSVQQRARIGGSTRGT